MTVREAEGEKIELALADSSHQDRLRFLDRSRFQFPFRFLIQFHPRCRGLRPHFRHFLSQSPRSPQCSVQAELMQLGAAPMALEA